jgi:hypothetical protein
MITAKLKAILTASGCTLVLYEQDKLANLYTDQSNQLSIVGLIVQLNEVILDVRANAIPEHYNPLVIEVFRQVRMEDAADNNEIAFQEMLDLCKEIIVRLIADADFKTIMPMRLTKIQETKYDANVIGWSMPFDLYYLHNEIRTPCI